MNSDCYEKLDPEIEAKEKDQQFLRVTGLQKVYENGFHAVKGINVKMYAD